MTFLARPSALVLTMEAPPMKRVLSPGLAQGCRAHGFAAYEAPLFGWAWQLTPARRVGGRLGGGPDAGVCGGSASGPAGQPPRPSPMTMRSGRLRLRHRPGRSRLRHRPGRLRLRHRPGPLWLRHRPGRLRSSPSPGAIAAPPAHHRLNRPCRLAPGRAAGQRGRHRGKRETGPGPTGLRTGQAPAGGRADDRRPAASPPRPPATTGSCNSPTAIPGKLRPAI